MREKTITETNNKTGTELSKRLKTYFFMIGLAKMAGHPMAGLFLLPGDFTFPTSRLRKRATILKNTPLAWLDQTGRLAFQKLGLIVESRLRPGNG
jgi:hypothetical protein